MNLAVSEMIIDSVAGPIKAELQSKTAEEAFILLKERYSRTGVSSYCSIGMRLCALRQLPQQSIQEYITKFDSLRSEFEAADGKIDISIQLAMFVAGLQQQYNKEAFSELNRQKGDPDVKALQQTLIRFATFEKSQRDTSKSTMQEARHERLRQQQQGQPQTSERTTSNKRLL